MTTVPETAAKSINCPACGAPITLRALGASVMVVCASCKTQIDVSRPEIQVIKKFNEAAQEFDVPLGTRGTLRGKAFEVIGAMLRTDDDGAWNEYLLFNPHDGFRWLVQDRGHWSLAETIKDISALKVDYLGIHYDHSTFRKFRQSKAVVESVVGEFYWRVKVGSQADTTDFIAPPRMLSKEKTPTEQTWSLLTYLDPAEVQQAFNITPEPRDDIAAHQPCPAKETLASIGPYVWGALGIAVLLQTATVIAARHREIPIGTYTPSSSHGKEAVFGPVHLDAKRSLNELTAYSPLDNSWVDLDYALIRKDGGESYQFANGIEAYSGVDSDGGWSEGSNVGRAIITSLPAGDYDLIVDSTSGDAHGAPSSAPVRLSLTHDVAPWRNFWIACGVILLYPLYLIYRRLVFERERWSDSAFNPYAACATTPHADAVAVPGPLLWRAPVPGSRQCPGLHTVCIAAGQVLRVHRQSLSQMRKPPCPS
jgi:hypothetical protein